jgi:uncharacterized protein
LTAATFSVAQVVVLAAAVLFSALVTAVAGFGFGLMSVPLMSLAVDLHSAVIVSSFVGAVGNGVQVRLYRKVRDRALANRLTIASIFGLPFGYAVYALVSDTALRVVLFAGILVAVAVLARGVNLTHVGPGMDWVLGFTSGVLNSSISTSGPPLVFDLQSRKLPPERFRGTINFVFLVSGVLGLAIYAIGGRVHRNELIAAAVAVPALFAGLGIGLPLRKHFSPERFRVLVLVLLLVSAFAAVAKAFI